MRVLCLISAVAILAAGCSGERIVTTDEPPAASPPTSTTSAPPPPPNTRHLVNAFDYVAHPAGTAVYYFTTPSGRWACAIVPRAKAGCQSATSWQSSMNITGEPDTVPNAEGEQTAPNAVIIEHEGQPRFVALEQPEFVLENAKVLGFNRILAAAGFRCNVQEAGVSCMSEATGRGFTFAPEGFKPQYTRVPADAP
ncbi:MULTISPECIES: hypothetical protein [unclassified Mycobacterium]|uniref:hypothetical protein n=1 Tax=unclassified Mycobacterium TaxID=2642494 RepID=UPI00073FB4EF|nr:MULTISPECIES: hypothetical protein [unclassified Mycobacterium]KUH88743.1 hypothetical protein AU185_02700 [Mycobacterium sp. GA-0227b]KUH91037.1 hypothetical protein AU186_19195 [Mycobacterium sp. GA-1999]KUH95390.1 hypothetical protein AU187_10550 [Mycobacterium sp. IS-1556]